MKILLLHLKIKPFDLSLHAGHLHIKLNIPVDLCLFITCRFPVDFATCFSMVFFLGIFLSVISSTILYIMYTFRICKVRRDTLKQCHGLKHFECECEQAKSWMADIEATFRGNVDGGM